jgi:mRNA interferase MazF
MKKPLASSDPAPRRFDIVVVPFAYSDQFAEQRRPALVVSADAFNRKHGLPWVAMITSADNPRWDGDIPISSKAGLTAPSVIRTAKIAMIEPARAVRVAGKVDARTVAEVRKQLVEVVG